MKTKHVTHKAMNHDILSIKATAAREDRHNPPLPVSRRKYPPLPAGSFHFNVGQSIWDAINH
jgi:hypothetical protein